MSDADRLQLIVSLVNLGQLEAAAAEAASLADKAISVEAWRAIARGNANTQRFVAAQDALNRALQHAPGMPALRLERALMLAAGGDDAASLAELESLDAVAPNFPGLLVNLALALRHAGRSDEAEQRLRAGLRAQPADVAMHIQLAELRWQRGTGPRPTAEIEAAIERHPDDLKLRLVAADLLRKAGETPRALELLDGGLARVPDSPAFLTSRGVLLDELGRPHEALPFLRRALALARDPITAMRNLVPALLRTGAAAEALGFITRLREREPDEQMLLAWHATALRLLGDAGYGALHDYARLVRAYRPAAPAGYADIAAFNAAFARELTGLHREERHPLAQSLRGGTQTGRGLPRENPVISAFFELIDAPIRDYIAKLGGDAHHPTDRRRGGGNYRIAGSWSVQLKPAGFHVNHVHPKGWISSAYYVELPGTAREPASRAGWLKFGEPGFELPACPPDHFVEPEPGMLVLFPSYLWHGTVPFVEGGRRLTAAFDVVPD